MIEQCNIIIIKSELFCLFPGAVTAVKNQVSKSNLHVDDLLQTTSPSLDIVIITH